MKYRIEMIGANAPSRDIEADGVHIQDGWIVFFLNNPQGGAQREFFRVQQSHVISMGTARR